MNTKSTEHRVRQLEELVSHQEHLLEQLNDVVIALRSEIELIRKSITTEVSRLETKIESQTDPLDPNEKPPHY